VLSEIELTRNGPRGGKPIIAPWNPTSAQLEPKLFKYTLPQKTRR
jgi:hypothetical protein